MKIRVDHIGNARAPVVVIEDLWPEPQQLIDIAASRSDFSARSLYYPGVRTNAPPEYVRAVTSQLRDQIAVAFGVQGDLQITDATFSLTTTPPEKLVAFQRVPHFDSTDPNRFALLHYLCGPAHGGTSFYRHRATGTEVVTEENRETYIKLVNAEAKARGMPPPQYVDESTPTFERIAKYECAFNGALIYRGRNLHSVTVARPFVADANPRTGRLTVNIFLLASAH